MSQSSMSVRMVQTRALIGAAYRELNAKKLFWITMGLNLLVVLIFASLGINERGVMLLHKTFESDFNTSVVSKGLFYRLQFVSWGSTFWLSWIATILALVSTASIVPDLVKGGVVETMLSKPMSRSRLFLTRYLTGLLFVLLQVSVFCVGCFLVMGIRGGAWEPRLFLAIPIVLAFFSYLYAISAFFGMVTKSTITALLLTILIWFLLFLTNAADELLVQQREGVAVQVEDLEAREANQITLRDRALETAAGSEDTPLGEGLTGAAELQQSRLERTQTDLESKRASLQTWTNWTRAVGVVRTVLPKTSETIGLLDRYLMTQEELAQIMFQENGVQVEGDDGMPAMADPRAAERADAARRDRSLLWILGTSLTFEVLLVLLTTLLFVRRDF